MEDNIRDIMDFLNKIADEVTREMIYTGCCNCCFREAEGQFVAYRFADGETVERLFICIECMRLKCNPEGDCKVKGVSCNYVTKENKNPNVK